MGNKIIEGTTDLPLAVGAPVRVSRLDDLTHVRAELSRLYREARRREGRFPDALTAQRLANVLGAVRGAIEMEEVVWRLALLESTQRKATEKGHA